MVKRKSSEAKVLFKLTIVLIRDHQAPNWFQIIQNVAANGQLRATHFDKWNRKSFSTKWKLILGHLVSVVTLGTCSKTIMDLTFFTRLLLPRILCMQWFCGEVYSYSGWNGIIGIGLLVLMLAYEDEMGTERGASAKGFSLHKGCNRSSWTFYLDCR